MSSTPAEVVEQMTAAFNSGDLDTGIALLHPDAVDHSPPDGPVPGRVAWRERWAAARAAVPDLVVTTEAIVEQDELVARRLRLTGGHGPQRTETVGMDMVRVRNGVVLEHWALTR